jgi:putative tryptophan/tyrosine transport system substrate-binding protein
VGAEQHSSPGPRRTLGLQPRKVTRIGVLSAGKPGPTEAVFRGYGEGQNLAIEDRHAEGKPERLPALAAELVRLNVDVLVASGPEAACCGRPGTPRGRSPSS